MLNKIKLVWLNGKIIPFKQARIPIINHSLHYGSAVFEGIRCYKTKRGPSVFRLEDHVKRLLFSGKAMGMNIPYSKDVLVSAIKETISKNKLEECYVRPIFFYGEKMGLMPLGIPLHASIIAFPWNKYLKKDIISIKTSSFLRIHPQSSVMKAKISGHYSNSIIASIEAVKKGYDEALLLDYKGNIAEGSAENIFFVRGNTLFTPKKETILPGITRDCIMKIARDNNYKVVEKNIKIKDLPKYEEAFLVGTAVEISPVGKIDKIVINDYKIGKATKKIKEIYEKAVRGEEKKYSKWLSFIQ